MEPATHQCDHPLNGFSNPNPLGTKSVVADILSGTSTAASSTARLCGEAEPAKGAVGDSPLAFLQRFLLDRHSKLKAIEVRDGMPKAVKQLLAKGEEIRAKSSPWSDEDCAAVRQEIRLRELLFYSAHKKELGAAVRGPYPREVFTMSGDKIWLDKGTVVVDLKVEPKSKEGSDSDRGSSDEYPERPQTRFQGAQVERNWLLQQDEFPIKSGGFSSDSDEESEDSWDAECDTIDEVATASSKEQERKKDVIASLTEDEVERIFAKRGETPPSGLLGIPSTRRWQQAKHKQLAEEGWTPETSAVESVNAETETDRGEEESLEPGSQVLKPDEPVLKNPLDKGRASPVPALDLEPSGVASTKVLSSVQKETLPSEQSEASESQEEPSSNATPLASSMGLDGDQNGQKALGPGLSVHILSDSSSEGSYPHSEPFHWSSRASEELESSQSSDVASASTRSQVDDQSSTATVRASSTSSSSSASRNPNVSAASTHATCAKGPDERRVRLLKGQHGWLNAVLACTLVASLVATVAVGRVRKVV